MKYFRQTLRKDCVEAINKAVKRLEELEVYVLHAAAMSNTKVALWSTFMCWYAV